MRLLFLLNFKGLIMSINKVQKEHDSQKLRKDSENHLEQREDPPQKWNKHWEEFLKHNIKEANMGKMYVEPSGYFTESMKKILEEGETKKTILFEYLSHPCLDFSACGLKGFTVYDDGSYFETTYKTNSKNDNLFSGLNIKKFDEKNYHRKLIFTSKKLAATISEFTVAHKEEIKNLPEHVSNYFVLDGNEDIIRVNDKLISGGNVFYSVPYKIDDSSLKNLNEEQQKNEKALELLTSLYAEIINIAKNEKKK